MEEVNVEVKTKKTPEQLLIEKLKEFKIIPEILSDVPLGAILILFKSGVKVNNGNLISFYQSQRLPLFYWPVDNLGTLYSLIIIDVDYPDVNNPVDRSYLIFLVFNIQGNDIMKGDIVADYKPIKPDKDSGSHRTLILNFKQLSFLKIETRIKDEESRLKFSLDDFIQKYNLDKPIAGNFYICSN